MIKKKGNLKSTSFWHCINQFHNFINHNTFVLSYVLATSIEPVSCWCRWIFLQSSCRWIFKFSLWLLNSMERSLLVTSSTLQSAYGVSLYTPVCLEKHTNMNTQKTHRKRKMAVGVCLLQFLIILLHTVGSMSANLTNLTYNLT